MTHIPHHSLHDPADLFAALQRSAPIRSCHSLVPDPLFLHQVGYLEIGEAVIVSQSGSATDFLVEHTPNLHLLALFQGHIALETAGGKTHLTSNGAALVPAGLRRSSGAHSLASITLEPGRVAAAAAAISGRPWRASREWPSPDAIPLLSLQPNTTARAIHSLLATIDSCAAIGADVATRLGLDDVCHRLAATLLQPGLLQEEPADLLRYRDPAGRSSFDNLIDYIRANLDQPLRLSDLEARSHYSRRALQYAFRQRLNSTPKQWIREQRLALAMEQLQRDGKRPTVREVALLCGYGHLSHFSKDFLARFGMKPSEVRRL